jgi:hypothetical protein
MPNRSRSDWLRATLEGSSSQSEVFHLEAYRLVQRGPSLPTAQIPFDRQSGHYNARTQENKEPEQTAKWREANRLEARQFLSVASGVRPDVS